MRRRAFAVFVVGIALWPVAGLAQRVVKRAKIGFLYFASQRSATETRRYPAFLVGMSELGYAEGRDFVIEARFADGRAERLPQLAAELLDAGVDVIVPGGNPAIRAAFEATKTIPIVIAQSPDPVAQGWAASLARPGGNLTGLISVAGLLELKLLEFMSSLVPRLSRLAVLSNPGNPAHPPRLASIRQAAQKSNATVTSVAAQSPEEIVRAFQAMKNARAQALIVLGDTYFLSQVRQIAELALAARLPSSHTLSDYAEAGGLISYGTDIADNFRRAAIYVDKILKGARPGDLPIEQPNRFEVVINMKTAKVLGVEVPQAMMLRADRVIR